MWLCCGPELLQLTIKRKIIVSQKYLYLLTWNFTSVMIVPTWPHPCSNFDIEPLFPPSVKWKWQKSTFCSFALCQSPLSLQRSAWTQQRYYFCFCFLASVSYTSIYNNTVNSIFAQKLLLDLTQSSFYSQKHDYARLSSPLESPRLQNLFLLLVCLVSTKCCVSQRLPGKYEQPLPECALTNGRKKEKV